MEMRYNEIDRARAIYERYVRCIPDVKAWVRYAKFEMQVGHVDKARGVYERAVQELDGEPSIVRAILPAPRCVHVESRVTVLCTASTAGAGCWSECRSRLCAGDLHTSAFCRMSCTSSLRSLRRR